MPAAMSLPGEEQTAQPNVFTPAKLGPVTLRNRIIKAATFEASTPNSLVTDDLITYHRLPAAGGVAMTTVAPRVRIAAQVWSALLMYRRSPLLALRISTRSAWSRSASEWVRG